LIRNSRLRRFPHIQNGKKSLLKIDDVLANVRNCCLNRRPDALVDIIRDVD
jgi:hypothetical protein